jgi:parafibromin
MKSAEWDKLVDDIAKSEDDDGDVDKDSRVQAILDVALNFAPRIPSEVVEHVKRPRDLFYSPQMTVEEAMRVRPAQPHETDALARERPENSFAKAVERALTNKIAPAKVHAPDFDPIIMVPSSAQSIVQMSNVKAFLQEGKFYACLPSAEAETEVFVRPDNFPAVNSYRVSFRKFRVLSDPRQVTDWNQVCACFVTGRDWQFEQWFNGDKTRSDPAMLFDQVRGFFPYFEEEKLPAIIKQWQVVPLLMTQKDTKAHSSVRVAATFWQELYKFLDSHPLFRPYTVATPGRITI